MKADPSAPPVQPYGINNPPAYTDATNPAYPQGYSQPAPPMGQSYYGSPPLGQQNYGPPLQGPGQNLTSTTTNVTIQPGAMPATSMIVQHFRESPIRINCNFCKADVVTAINYETGTLTWVAAGVICLLGFVIGCCLVPFCIDGCKDVVHTCPNCRQVVGRYNRM
ncbi:DgyrCDS2945 [Dimorphilus gyrociliatus]|uniref:DgyrCDS2945 n=1 Tax=Dimorphilus gyrociliatus TaxID=2664684 RepID=A0A7I8VCB0_9ANNE|nr:DgyrCDS2945 [Dimorphilus gyrociliatus]